MTISPTRNSADTAYAAREARKLLQRLGVVVDASNGRVTRALAGLWGLHAILNPDAENKKNREDHRHHAIDALATAFASAAFVKRLSEHYAQERGVKRGDDFKKPWLRFFEDAAASVKAIVVSHRARRKVSGPLHEEKPLADTNETVVRDGITYRVFVRRKAVEELGSKEVDAIRDEEVKRIVRDHITTRGGDPKKAFPPYPSIIDSATGEVRSTIRRVRLRIERQMDLMVPLRVARTFAERGDVHHISIYRLPDGRARHFTVSRFSVARRQANGEAPIVRGRREENGEFALSLVPGEIL